jgi:hypothetical protein
MSEVIERDQLPANDQGAALIQVIERAATNPDVDIEKMERLFAMHERILGTQAEAMFNQEMSAAQSKMGRISADATNPQTHSKYATYGMLDSVLRPIYTEHGFALSFGTEDAPTPESVRVVCCVSHRAGHSRHYRIDMPADGKGAKGGDVMTKTHATGAAATYGMRYLLKMIFNVAIGEDDTDGNRPNSAVAAVLSGLKVDEKTKREYVAGIQAAIYNEDDSGLRELLRELKGEHDMKLAVWNGLNSKERRFIKDFEKGE